MAEEYYSLSYTAAEIERRLGKIDSMVSSINSVAPDENGNVELNISTPVRGIDYWTVDDVAAIESDISEKVVSAVDEYMQQNQTNGNGNSVTVVTKEPITYQAYEGNMLLVSGNTKEAENRVASDLISASAGEIYYLTCSANWANALWVAYKSDGVTVVDYGQAANTAEGTVWTEEEVTMPEETAYFRIGCNLDIQPDGHAISKKVTTTITGKWARKVWVAVGDSITEDNIRASKHYHEYISDETGISVVNMGVGGTGYKNGYNEENAFYQRVSAVPTDADVVTIFGSFNDLSTTLAAEIGSPTDTGTDTLCGCINTTIDNLYTVFPLARLGIITPTPWQYKRPDETESTNIRYVDAIVSICRLRGIPYLDLFRCSSLRPWEESFRNLAYTKDDGDGTHPDETGHAIIAPRIKAFLETLLM